MKRPVRCAPVGVPGPHAARCARHRAYLTHSVLRFPHYASLIRPLTAAMVAPDTAIPLLRSRRDRSAQPPSLAYMGAIAWSNPSRWWVQAVAEAGVSWYGVS